MTTTTTVSLRQISKRQKKNSNNKPYRVYMTETNKRLSQKRQDRRAESRKKIGFLVVMYKNHHPVAAAS
jgi:hypothetical protein